ncbi:MAG: methyltransferase domain-containing protein [Candidatus Aenigmarchaeota archaeon]|nr:methyltransferase domain-containing protein [Candidatus Aenigmarchaeota archaeon]
MHSPDFYNATAQSYDLRQQNPWTEILREKEKELIKKYAKGRILDVGCGTGFHLKYLEEKGFSEITGIDSSEEMLKLARKNTKAELLVADAEKLPFADESFVTVLCLFTVLNLCDAEKALGEINRALKKGSYAIFSVASVFDNKGRKRKKIHVDGNPAVFRLFSKDELELLLKKTGFSLIHFDSLFRSLRPKWGNWSPLTAREKEAIRNEANTPVEKGAIYLAVAAKT